MWITFKLGGTSLLTWDPIFLENSLRAMFATNKQLRSQLSLYMVSVIYMYMHILFSKVRTYGCAKKLPEISGLFNRIYNPFISISVYYLFVIHSRIISTAKVLIECHSKSASKLFKFS